MLSPKRDSPIASSYGRVAPPLFQAQRTIAMKTYTNKLRCWAVMSSLSLMATAYPAFGQNNNDSSSSSQTGAQQSQGTSVTEPSTTSGAQNTPAESPSLNRASPSERMSAADNTAGRTIDEPAGADNSAGNWSWIGLIGLLGLFGLKRHHDVRDETYRQART